MNLLAISPQVYHRRSSPSTDTDIRMHLRQVK